MWSWALTADNDDDDDDDNHNNVLDEVWGHKGVCVCSFLPVALRSHLR